MNGRKAELSVSGVKMALRLFERWFPCPGVCRGLGSGFLLDC